MSRQAAYYINGSLFGGFESRENFSTVEMSWAKFKKVPLNSNFASFM
jgi:hypothetical protein